MSVLSSLRIGGRGLAAASAGILVTTQNVTNAGVSGYARRRLELVTLDPLQRNGLWVGQGVGLLGVHRAGDRLLAQQVSRATGESAYADALYGALNLVEAYFDESSATGVTEALDGWFDALGSAAADPSDPGLRQEVVSAAESLVSAVSTTAQGLEDTLEGLDLQLGDGLEEVNDALTELASLNAAIVASGGDAAEYLDRRDQLVDSLSSSIGAQVELAADGQVSVFIGGHAAVSGSEARTLTAATGASGETELHLAFGPSTIDVTGDLGGSLGGIVEARGATQGYLDTLDHFAYTFANAVNTQHALGWDASGNPGGAVFSVPAAEDGAAASWSVDAALAADPGLLAFAGAATAEAGDGANLDALFLMETDTTVFASETAHSVLSGLVSEVGSDVSMASAASEGASALLLDLKGALESVSGVNLDEEAIQLIEYQAAYSAASSVISAVDEMLQELINLGR